MPPVKGGIFFALKTKFAYTKSATKLQINKGCCKIWYMKCLIIINRLSGNGKKADENILKQTFGNGFDTDVFYVRKNTPTPNLLPYDRIVACGGDGTLNRLVNNKTKQGAQVFYCPYGTLNEVATGKANTLQDVCLANDKKFAYVLATGIFTPLGYRTKDSQKQKFKALAYLFNVVKHYKIAHIYAQIEHDGSKTSDTYALLLAIDSPKCFGFKFNKAYAHDDNKMHLLLIKSPKRKNIFGKIKIFFPLFRAFFVGFKKEYHSKNMSFVPFENLAITLTQPTDFCMDGELATFDGKIDVSLCKADTPVIVVSKEQIEDTFKQGKSF